MIGIVENGNLRSLNCEFMKMKSGIHEVEMAHPVFRKALTSKKY
jgi:hypothetical protein